MLQVCVELLLQLLHRTNPEPVQMGVRCMALQARFFPLARDGLPVSAAEDHGRPGCALRVHHQGGAWTAVLSDVLGLFGYRVTLRDFLRGGGPTSEDLKSQP